MPIEHATRGKRSIQTINCSMFEIKSAYLIGKAYFDLYSI